MQKLLTELQPAIQRIFPESLVSVMERKHALGTGTYVLLTFALGKDGNEWSGGYISNDNMHHHIVIDPIPGNDFQVTTRHTKILLVPNKDDPKEKYMAYGSVKTGWRDFKSHSEEAIITKLVNHFHKVKDIMRQNKARLTTETLALAEKKGYFND